MSGTDWLVAAQIGFIVAYVVLLAFLPGALARWRRGQRNDLQRLGLCVLVLLVLQNRAAQLGRSALTDTWRGAVSGWCVISLVLAAQIVTLLHSYRESPSPAKPRLLWFLIPGGLIVIVGWAADLLLRLASQGFQAPGG